MKKPSDESATTETKPKLTSAVLMDQVFRRI